jgi:2-polyprenyl-6-methoxyphenol hydroxylase-like FAD-dependent oxidoreductase
MRSSAMKILVSGAGIAGLSAAIDLEQAGHEVTIVERADHLRVNGSPIDIRGDSIAVAEKMGVLDDIRARRIDMTERVQFVDRDGTVVAEIPEDRINDSADDIEIPREDLTRILHAKLGPRAPTAVRRIDRRSTRRRRRRRRRLRIRTDGSV